MDRCCVLSYQQFFDLGNPFRISTPKTLKSRYYTFLQYHNDLSWGVRTIVCVERFSFPLWQLESVEYLFDSNLLKTLNCFPFKFVFRKSGKWSNVIWNAEEFPNIFQRNKKCTKTWVWFAQGTNLSSEYKTCDNRVLSTMEGFRERLNLSKLLSSKTQ